MNKQILTCLALIAAVGCFTWSSKKSRVAIGYSVVLAFVGLLVYFSKSILLQTYQRFVQSEVNQVPQPKKVMTKQPKKKGNTSYQKVDSPPSQPTTFTLQPPQIEEPVKVKQEPKVAKKQEKQQEQPEQKKPNQQQQQKQKKQKKEEPIILYEQVQDDNDDGWIEVDTKKKQKEFKKEEKPQQEQPKTQTKHQEPIKVTQSNQQAKSIVEEQPIKKPLIMTPAPTVKPTQQVETKAVPEKQPEVIPSQKKQKKAKKQVAEQDVEEGWEVVDYKQTYKKVEEEEQLEVAEPIKKKKKYGLLTEEEYKAAKAEAKIIEENFNRRKQLIDDQHRVNTVNRTTEYQVKNYEPPQNIIYEEVVSKPQISEIVVKPMTKEEIDRLVEEQMPKNIRKIPPKILTQNTPFIQQAQAKQSEQTLIEEKVEQKPQYASSVIINKVFNLKKEKENITYEPSLFQFDGQFKPNQQILNKNTESISNTVGKEIFGRARRFRRQVVEKKVLEKPKATEYEVKEVEPVQQQAEVITQEQPKQPSAEKTQPQPQPQSQKNNQNKNKNKKQQSQQQQQQQSMYTPKQQETESIYVPKEQPTANADVQQLLKSISDAKIMGEEIQVELKNSQISNDQPLQQISQDFEILKSQNGIYDNQQLQTSIIRENDISLSNAALSPSQQIIYSGGQPLENIAQSIVVHYTYSEEGEKLVSHETMLGIMDNCKDVIAKEYKDYIIAVRNDRRQLMNEGKYEEYLELVLQIGENQLQIIQNGLHAIAKALDINDELFEASFIYYTNDDLLGQEFIDRLTYVQQNAKEIIHPQFNLQRQEGIDLIQFQLNVVENYKQYEAFTKVWDIFNGKPDQDQIKDALPMILNTIIDDLIFGKFQYEEEDKIKFLRIHSKHNEVRKLLEQVEQTVEQLFSVQLK